MDLKNFARNRILEFLRRRSIGWSNVESVEDVHANILSRVPVQSLLCFKAVSKLWYRLICSPRFMKLHLSQSSENPIYLSFPFVDDLKSMQLIDADGVLVDTIPLPGFQNLSTLSMLCSYNGLICFTNYPWFPRAFWLPELLPELEIEICNPATREVYTLPRGSPSDQELGIGVAFGPGVSDYRVFRFFSSKHEFVFLPKCEVFSSSTGLWRSAGYVEHRPMGSNHVFVNGKVHWFIPSEEDHNTPGGILLVDLEEHFQVIKLPFELTEHSFLIDLEGCLSVAVVSHCERLTMEIWILRDENEFFWENKCRASVPCPFEAEWTNSVAARKNEIFMVTTERNFIFNTNEHTWKELFFDSRLERGSSIVFSYTESLLPPL